MPLIDIREFIEISVTAVSVLGGAMAVQSGNAASRAMARKQTAAVLSQQINEGIGHGFNWGSPTAVCTFMILLWT